MKSVCAAGPLVRGIDIYHGDAIDDIRKVVADGIQYAYLKAWEYSEDPSFRTRWPAMKNAGLLRGAYDFFHPKNDPILQAKGFMALIGKLGVNDLPCALDWESTDGVSPEIDKARALQWLAFVEAASGKTPIIYTGPYFANALALDSRFKRYGLWIANYGVHCPLVPAPWDTWTMWQGSESGLVPGMNGHCDTDVFNGTLDQLKGLT